ncbi:hypothetical protein CAEBREN_08338 [Caenorhabditis brenneri]|uniref:Uncharacterized protein n=1 Tax=Caenorhabditis brenneri TaxID=135651 RepID=G0MYG9_CAEBE|nr:hypothetical protein CAEBREN_08338 [Caenorhabditis brenneri]
MNGEHQEQNVINQRREALIEDLIEMISGRQVGDVKNILRGIHEQEGLSLIKDFRLLHGICLGYVSVRHEADDHIGIHDSLREECYDLISFACDLFEKSEHPITMVRYEDEDRRSYSLLDVAILTRNHHLIRELFRRADDGTYYSNTDEDEIPLSNCVQDSIDNYVFRIEEDRTLLREERVYMEKMYTLTITQQEIEDPPTNGSNKAASFISRVLRSKVLHQKMTEVAVIEDNSTKEVLNARISMIISSLHTKFGVHPSHILDSDNNSFLHLSIAYENVAATRALLEAKVSVDRDNSQRNTPLDNAVAVGNQEIFEMLCHRGADIVWVENPTNRELVPKE